MSATEEMLKDPLRPRREFSTVFKAEAAKQAQEVGKPIPQVARDLDLTEPELRLRVTQTKTKQGEGKPGAPTTAEREELAWLRKENRELRLEPEILKSTATVFAKELKRALLGLDEPLCVRALVDSLREYLARHCARVFKHGGQHD